MRESARKCGQNDGNGSVSAVLEPCETEPLFRAQPYVLNSGKGLKRWKVESGKWKNLLLQMDLTQKTVAD